MFDWLMDLQWWQWWIVAAVLAAVETFLPGAVAIWFGVSAAIMGTLLWFFPTMPWVLQVLLFAVLGFVGLMAYRSYLRKNPATDDEQPLLNQRGQQYVGKIFTTSEPIAQGAGKIRVGDGHWNVSGPDTPAGQQVKVVGVDGTVLKVQAP